MSPVSPIPDGRQSGAQRITANHDTIAVLDIPLLDAVLGLIPDAAVAVDDQGQIVGANRMAADLFGYQSGELVGTAVEGLVPERLRSAHTSHCHSYGLDPQARRMGSGHSLWGRRKDGTEFVIDVSLAPLTAPGRPVVVAAIRDMTECAKQQAAQWLVSAIVRSTDDAVVSMTAEGLITSWNPGAERFLGYPEGEIVGHAGTVLVPDGERGKDERALRGVLAGEHPVRYETRRRRKDGSEVEVEVALSLVHEPSGRPLGVAAVLRDITERRQIEAEMARAQLAREQLMMAADRDRIASDLHGLVIQRLFSAGMALHGVANVVDHPEAAARIRGVVDVLDTTISDLRRTIFALELRLDRSTTRLPDPPEGEACVE